ncbi:MAG TPA: hypothetical protein VHO71_03090 [Caproiciproducens sp.]|nr:hypothetical protein [Caproiciproducens sp.]
MVRKSTGILLSAVLFFLGIIFGFFMAPMKGGVNLNIGNNSGNQSKPEAPDTEDF